jgi:hypothetical protein
MSNKVSWSDLIAFVNLILMIVDVCLLIVK